MLFNKIKIIINKITLNFYFLPINFLQFLFLIIVGHDFYEFLIRATLDGS